MEHDQFHLYDVNVLKDFFATTVPPPPYLDCKIDSPCQNTCLVYPGHLGHLWARHERELCDWRKPVPATSDAIIYEYAN